jgi:hypothetical protein
VCPQIKTTPTDVVTPPDGETELEGMPRPTLVERNETTAQTSKTEGVTQRHRSGKESK